ncbi:MAG: hypothetical protein ACRDVZ_17645 [Jiangellaceae bacterium]
MALANDIPSRYDIERLASSRRAGSISVYLPTTPISPEADANRIELKNLATGAVDQLRAAHHDKREVAAIEESIEGLLDDALFWRFQSHSLAVFVTADRLTTFRLPNNLGTFVEVSDRFFIKPLLRAVTFPQEAFILAIARNAVRLVELSADLPPRIVDDVTLPDSAADAVGLPSIAGRALSGRIQGSEGQKVRLTQYARAVDSALRGVLTGHSQPLILAATEPLDSIYRSVNSYPHLVDAAIEGSPEKVSDAELAAAARKILDEHYAGELDHVKQLFEERSSQGRTLTDVTDIARAATYGSVDTLLVDIDQSLPGVVDEKSGEVTFSNGDDAVNYGVVDEIARRALLAGGRIYAVRQDDVPGGGAAAAILRYV